MRSARERVASTGSAFRRRVAWLTPRLWRELLAFPAETPDATAPESSPWVWLRRERLRRSSIASGDRHALPGVWRGADVEKIAVVRDLVGRAGRRRGRRARADQPAQIVERLWCRCDDPEVRAIELQGRIFVILTDRQSDRVARHAATRRDQDFFSGGTIDLDGHCLAVVGRKTHDPTGTDRRRRRQGYDQRGRGRVVVRHRIAIVGLRGCVGADRWETPSVDAGGVAGNPDLGRRRRGRLDPEVAAV